MFTPSEAESVKLLTVHRAKGLEWNTVFVPFMSATVFPDGAGPRRLDHVRQRGPHGPAR